MRFKTAKLQTFKKALFPVLLLSVLIGLSAGPTQGATSGNSSPTQNNVLGTSLVQNTAPAPESRDTNGRNKNADQVDQPGTATLTMGTPIAGIPIIPAWQWTNITGATSAIYSPIAGNDGKNPWASVSYTENCSSGGAVTNPGSNPGLLADCAILLSIKNEIAGGALLNWTSDTPIGSWDGINTGGTPERVAGINLNNRSLTGRVPKELGNLGGLETLYLSGNSLTGGIPEELGRLGNLRSLNLGGNSLAGGIPEELGELAGLTSLYLYKNILTGEIPEELGDLTSLEYLSLQCNKLSGPIPDELADLAALVNFQLGGNRLAQPVPPALAGIANTSNASCGSAFNSAPVFSEPPPVSREVPENTTIGNSFGDPVTAADVHFGTITDDVSYSLTGTDAASFTIDPSTGQLSLNTTLDHSTKPLYSVQAKAEDDYGGEATEPITIIVTVTAGTGSEAQAGAVNKAGDGSWPVITTAETLTYACDNGTAVDNPVSNPELVDDCDALLRIKATLDPDDYLDWSVDSDIEDWEGITVFGTPKRVIRFNYKRYSNDTDKLTGSLSEEFSELDALTRIDLEGNSLTGGIPEELGNLTNLTQLYLTLNSLTGGIPEELGDLSNLNYLYLGNNSLTGGIPEELGSLTNLTRLDLGNNSLTGGIPEELGSLTSLVNVSLDSNSLTGEIPAELGSLSSLVHLGLSNNSLTGEIPAELGSLSSLNSLYLGSNSLTGEIPEELGSLSNLDSLYLSHNSLTGEIPAELGSLSSLVRLSLNNNSLTGKIPEELGSLSNLRGLYLYNNSLTGVIPEELGSLPSLTWLYLGNNSLTGGIPEELGDLSSLVHLSLESNSLTGEIPAELGSLTSLRSLSLTLNSLTGEIPEELGNLSNLLALILDRNSLTGEIPEELGDLTNLGYLYLSNNSLTGEIPEELGDLTSLESLYLGGNSLTGEIPEELGSLSSLRSLGLDGNGLTGEIPEELGNLSDLTHLHLYCNKLSGPIPDELEDLGDLQSFYIGGNRLTGPLPPALASIANTSDSTCGSAFNSAPAFSETAPLSREVPEDTTLGTSFGDPVTATDVHFGTITDDVSYSLSGTDAASFTIDPSTGQLSLNTTLDYSTKSSYSVEAKAEDDYGGETSEPITLNVTVLPGAPALTGLARGTTRLTVNWTAPEDDGGTTINAYDVRYRQTSATDWTLADNAWTSGDLKYEVTGLTAGTEYEAQARAVNNVGDGPWSPSATAETLTLTYACDNGTAVDNPLSNPGLVYDCDALLRGKDTLDPDDYLDWSVDSNIRNWEGITVFGTPKRVTKFNYQRYSSYTGRLTGSLPRELSELDALTRIDLYNNSLTGEIPEELGSLSNLGFLDLQRNLLTGEIPEELGNLSNLTSLYLYYNNLTGGIPEELGDLTNLEYLGLSYNSLTGEIPEELGSLSNLRGLYLSSNSLTGGIPEELGSLSNLRGLNLGGNLLTGEIPEELGDLSNLTYLNIYNNSLTGGIPEELGGLTNLTNLYLSSNRLTGGIPEELGGLSNLTELELRSNSLTGGIPEELGSLSNLRGLNLGSNPLNGEIPEELGNLSNLRSLWLYGNLLTGEIPEELGGLTSLTGLYLQGNRLTGQIPEELGDLTNLTSLILYHNDLTGEIPEELGDLTSLTYLSLYGNSLTGGIPEELGSLTSMRELQLNNNGLTGGIPEELGSLTSMRKLQLNNNGLTGEIPEELGNLSSLEYLHLYCNKLSGPIPEELADLGTLQSFQLGGNRLAQPVPPALAGIANTSNASCGSAFNSAPVFSEPPPVSREVPENTTIGNSFGDPVTAADVHFGTITDDVSYSLTGTDAASFTIDPSTGQLSLNTTLDHSTKSSYSVQVKAEDDHGGEATEPVTLNVIAPPGAPAVTGLARGTTRLTVNWTAPDDDGGTTINAYDVRYRQTSAIDWTLVDNAWTSGDLKYEVTGLTAGTEYEAQARAVNNVGDGPWSPSANADTLTYACDNDTAVENPVDNPRLVDDCDALLRGKKTLDPDDYLDWSIESDIRYWEGITVAGSPKRVIRFNYRRLFTDTDRLTGSLSAELSELDALTYIDLSGNDLTGGIPEELGDLSNLTSLSLSNNSLTGGIPEELGNLTNLTNLSLSNNDLTGGIPEELGDLSNLTSLYLSNNSLTGGIPEELGDLSNLTSLSLYGNSLTGGIPEELGNLSNLTSLSLYGNSLTGGIPEELGNLSNLTSLSLSKNSLTGGIPEELGNLSNLVYLYLHNNSLTGGIPEELGDLTNLTDLRLSSNSLTGGIPEQLGNLTNLYILYLYDNDLTGGIPEELGGLSNLTSLYLQGNSLTGEIPEELGDLSNLRSLYLYNNDLTGEIPEELGDLSNLRSLYLYSNDLTGEIPEELGNLTSLTRLYLGNNDLTGEIPEELGDLTSLIWLYLQNNRLTGKIPEELGNLTNLTNLYLNNNRLTGEIPEELGDLSDMTHLWLQCNKLSGPIPEELADLGTLQSFQLGGNRLTGPVPPALAGIANTSNASCGSAFNSTPAFSETAPVSREVPENTPADSNIGEPVGSTDSHDDPIVYALSGTDQASFSIVAGTGQILTATALDHETKPSYSLEVEASDPYGGESAIAVTISLTDMNEPPEFNVNSATRSIDENSPLGTALGEPVSATDPDYQASPIYNLSGTGHNNFTVDSSGQITVAPEGDLNHEMINIYALTLSVSDGQADNWDADISADDTVPVAVSVNNINEAPSEPAVTDQSGIQGGDFTYQFPASVDPENDPISYSFTVSPQAPWLSLDASTRTFGGTFTDAGEFDVTVTANDGQTPAGISSKPFRIEVAPNNPPAFSSPDLFDVAENTTTAGTLTAGDPDPADDITDYRITGGVDQENFELDANTGALRFNTPPDYDAPTDQESTMPEDPAGNNRYLVQVTVSSGIGNRELTKTQSITVQVNKKRSSSTSNYMPNSPPQATGDNYTVPEGGSITTTRALSVLSNDSDLNQDPITAELITGPQHAGTGFTLNRDGTFTYQHDGSETLSDSFTYQARDRFSSSNTATAAITITPVNDPPLVLEQIPPLTLLTGESETIISVDGKFFDAEGGPLTHTATSDNEPVITLRWKEGAAIAPVQAGEARVTVTATDPEGESASIEFTVTVNQALAFELGNIVILQVPENAPPGSPVGNPLTASGEDSVLEYRLFGSGQNHFSVDSSTGQIISGSPLNYEVKDQYGLFVTVHDDQEGSSLIEVTINVTDIEEPPGQPLPPALSASGSGQLTAVWTEPANRGPVITGYELRYKVWFHESWSIDRTEDTESAIPDLGAEERYEVQVRAINDEGEGPWSVSAYGKIAAQTKKLPQEPSPAASSHSSDQSPKQQIVSKIQTNQAVPYQAQTDQPFLSQEEISQPALSSPAPEPEPREGVLPLWAIALMTSGGLITALAAAMILARRVRARK